MLYKVGSTQWDPHFQCIVAVYSRYSSSSSISSSSSNYSSNSSLFSEMKRKPADLVTKRVRAYDTRSQARGGGGSGGGSGGGGGDGGGGSSRKQGASKKRKGETVEASASASASAGASAKSSASARASNLTELNANAGRKGYSRPTASVGNSGYRGVSCVGDKFMARISHSGVQEVLGNSFPTAIAAARAYNVRAKELGKLLNEFEDEDTSKGRGPLVKAGYKGVYSFSRGHKFWAKIWNSTTQIHEPLGYSFPTAIAAARAYNVRAKELGKPLNVFEDEDEVDETEEMGEMELVEGDEEEDHEGEDEVQ